MNNNICAVPVPRIAYEGGFTVEYIRGEYTGFSHITGKHHFSLYNGETVKLTSLKGVQFDTVQINQP
jgi:hypothetical protein